MPFFLIREDITRMHTDAIVNAANRRLLPGGGVCGAIFAAAGAQQLTAVCDKLAPVQTGEAVITPGFNLAASYIIHTPGPVYAEHSPSESKKLLADSYRNSLKLAYENGCRSIAFPLISSGIYGFPKKEALKTASETIEQFLEDHEMNVYLTVFDKEAYQISTSLQKEVESFINDHYVDTHTHERLRNLHAEPELDSCPVCAPMAVPGSHSGRSVQDEFCVQSCASPDSLEQRLEAMDAPFNQTLFSLIDARGLTDAQVYKKANLDRKLFSKIRTKKDYIPKKQTILALAFALELDQEETEMLLERAGYALSNASKLDVIVQFFIQNQKYNIFEINQVLFQYHQPLLGSAV